MDACGWQFLMGRGKGSRRKVANDGGGEKDKESQEGGRPVGVCVMKLME